MSDVFANLTIRADAQSVPKATRDLHGLSAAVAKAESGIGSLTAAAPRLGLALAGAFTVTTIAATVRSIAAAGDAYQQVYNRVKLVSTSLENATLVQRTLVGLANETRAPLEDVAKIYSRISAASAGLGASQSDVLRLTQGIAQTFALSGASAAEAASSGTQLAQALGSGTLAGDELKSILENNLVLAQAIAAGFGVSVGELKKLGAEGKLTSEGVFKALLSQTDEIAKKAGTIAPTMSQGMATLKSGVGSFLGQIDDAIGLSRTLGSIFDSIGRTIGGIDVGSIFESAGRMASGNQAGRTEPSRRLTLEQTQARDAALRNPAFRAGGLRPGETGFDLGFGGGEMFAGGRDAGVRSRQFFQFGTAEAKAADGDLRKLYEDLAKQAADAAADARASADRRARDLEQRDIADQADRRTAEQAYLGLLSDIANDARTVRPSSGFMDGISVTAPELGSVRDLQTMADALQAQSEALADSSRRAQATTQALADGLQRSIAQGIAGGFTDGAKSFAAFAENLKRTLINVLSEATANSLVGGLLGKSGGTGGGLGSLFSGIGKLFGGGGGGASPSAAGGGGFGSGALAGFGLLAGSQILGLFNSAERRTYGNPNAGFASSPIRIDSVQALQAEQQAAGTYLAPAGFNAGAYRYEAGKAGGTPMVTGNTITIVVPEGTTAEMAQELLVEFQRLARAQGAPAGALPTARVA